MTRSSNDRIRKKDVESDCEKWMKDRYGRVVFDKAHLEDVLTEMGVSKKTATRISGWTGTPQGFIGICFNDVDTT